MVLADASTEGRKNNRASDNCSSEFRLRDCVFAARVPEYRRATGWNTDLSDDAPAPAPIRLWQREVHIPGLYDLEVDTSLLSPSACA